MTSTTVDLFPRAFLIVFHQLAVGGFISLSIPPFHQIARGYYKSTAFVYLLSAVFALIGRIILWTGPAGTAQDGWRIVLWGVFVLVAAAYVATLWADPIVLRARLFTATLALGLIGLVVTAVSYVPEAGISLELMLYPAAFISSALLLGAAASGMLLGHWYLIDRDLSLTPFHNTLRFYVACLAAQALVLTLGVLLLRLGGAAVTRLGVEQLMSDHWRFLAARCLVSPIGASMLAWMIWRTLQVPQTMAATGLFYIAILAVMVGEFMGRYLLFRTGIPV